MADEPAREPPVAAKLPISTSIADNGAPVIFCDAAPISGFYNGIFHFSFEVVRHGLADGKVVRDRVMVAHLRMNGPALQSLKEAIANAELLAQPVKEGPKN